MGVLSVLVVLSAVALNDGALGRPRPGATGE